LREGPMRPEGEPEGPKIEAQRAEAGKGY